MKNRIADLLNEVEQDLGNKEDLFVPENKIFVRPEDGKLILPVVQNKGFELSNWATSQFCNRVGIPTKYYRNCPPELKAENANYWINELSEDKNLMFRVRHNDSMGIVRGILSERYSAFDDHEILDILNQILGASGKDYNIEMWQREDFGFHLRVTFPDLTAVVGKTLDGKPDIHKVGLHIENSEVGRKMIKIRSVVYRQVCTNGLMAWRTDGEFMQRHVGLRPNEMYNRVADGIGSSLKMGDEMIDSLIMAKEIPIKNPFEIIESMSKSKKYSNEFTDKVKSEFMREPMQNAFGVVQGFTAAARSINTDDRVDIERDAAELLSRLVVA